MHRRDALRSVAPLALPLAGCLSGDGPGAPRETPPSETESCRPSGTSTAAATPAPGFPRVRVETDPQPTSQGVRFEVGVLDQFTAEATARLSVSFVNAAGEERGFAFGAVVPFDEAWGDHAERDAKLALFPAGRLAGSETELGVVDADEDGTFAPVPDAPDGGCWQAEDAFAYAGEPQRATLGGCERVSRTYRTFAHPGNDPCLPGGAYRFETTWKPAASDEYRTWGFTVHVGD